MSKQLGLYIHIPFCKSKCDYCDFYSLPDREERMDAYQKALLTHIKETAPQARGYLVDTIYFGGGTPSLYGERRIRELLAVIRRRFEVAGNAEITLEANPDSADRRTMLHLRRAGINRISLGMQSAHDDELSALHRPHTFQQVQDAVAAIRAAKIRNLSLDLMYGLPGQDMARWQDSVEKAISLKPEHLSCYGLKVEEGTPSADGYGGARFFQATTSRPTCICGWWPGWSLRATISTRSPTSPSPAFNPATTSNIG